MCLVQLGCFDRFLTRHGMAVDENRSTQIQWFRIIFPTNIFKKWGCTLSSNAPKHHLVGYIYISHYSPPLISYDAHMSHMSSKTGSCEMDLHRPCGIIGA